MTARDGETIDAPDRVLSSLDTSTYDELWLFALGPALAESTFHHFADYNWDPRRGSPDFVSETPIYVLPNDPRAQASVRRYVSNVALWLAGRL